MRCSLLKDIKVISTAVVLQAPPGIAVPTSLGEKSLPTAVATPPGGNSPKFIPPAAPPPVPVGVVVPQLGGAGVVAPVSLGGIPMPMPAVQPPPPIPVSTQQVNSVPGM